MTARDDDREPRDARDARWRVQMRAAQDGDQSAYGALLAEILPMLRVFASGQREAIELTKVQGLSLKEASAVTGKSVASLKVNIHRAVKALRRSITTKT